MTTSGEAIRFAAFCRTWARGKLIQNFGANFWGPNRKRCSIVKPDMIDKMVELGLAQRVSGGFIVPKEER